MLLACLALVGAVVMAMRHRPLAFPIVAIVVGALEVLRAFGLVHISVARLPLALIFGALLMLCGIIVYARTQAKSAVAGATAVTLVGALQVLLSLKLT